MDLYHPVEGTSTHDQVTIINIVAIADSMFYIKNVNAAQNTNVNVNENSGSLWSLQLVQAPPTPVTVSFFLLPVFRVIFCGVIVIHQLDHRSM